jgi:hypothetical protein
MADRLSHQIALMVLAIGAALVPLPADIVERLYSTRFYVVVQSLLTPLSNLVSIALFDVLVLGVLTLWVGLAAVDIRRRGWMRGGGSIAARTLTWTSVLYLVFLACWGLNYRRVPLAEKLQFDRAAVNVDAARRVAAVSVDRVNALYEAAHHLDAASVDSGAPLAKAFARAAGELGLPPITVARPKRSLFDIYFQRAGVSGMTDPFLLETLVATDLLPVERPFVVAHEWSHLAGIGDEGEANFVGWVACLRGSAADQYSAWLFLYGELTQSVPARDRAALAASLAEGPRADLRAIRDRVARHLSPRVSAAGWRVYDSYLKANRVESGAASYAEVVRLVLGVRFADGWIPVRRP